MSTASQPLDQQNGTKPPLRMFNMVLFSVCAILLLSQLTLTAQVGPTSIFWTIVIAILFFVPYGLVTSELGSSYPDAGGIYSWVVRAFGNKWGTRVSWWYWVNVALWVPSVYLMFAGTLSEMFFHGELNFWLQILIAIALIWVNYFVNSRKLETGTWVSNLGAAITVAIIVILAISAIVFGAKNGSATEWTISSMLPSGGAHAIVLALPIIIYNFLGFELMSSASGQMENPKKDVPRAIMIAGILIGGFYLIATVAMQVITPAGDIPSTTGLIGVLQVAFGDSTFAHVIITILGIGALYCFFAALIPWTIGANMAAQESSLQGDLPKLFGKTDPKRGTPVGAALICSLVGTVVTLGYAILSAATDGAVDDVFWSLFAFSSVIFLLPYIALMLTFRKLRKIDPDTVRPYKVPGNNVVINIFTWVPVVLLAAAVFFFVVDPFEFDASITVPILIGIAIIVIIEEVLVKMAPKWAAARRAEAEAEGTTIPDPLQPAE